MGIHNTICVPAAMFRASARYKKNEWYIIFLVSLHPPL